MQASYRLPARYGAAASVQPVGARSRSQSAFTCRRLGSGGPAPAAVRTGLVESRSVNLNPGGRTAAGPARAWCRRRRPNCRGPCAAPPAVPNGGEGECPFAGLRTCEAVNGIADARSVRLYPAGALPAGAGGTGDGGGCAPRSAIRTMDPWEEAGTVPGRERELTRERRHRTVDAGPGVCRRGAIMRIGMAAHASVVWDRSAPSAPRRCTACSPAERTAPSPDRPVRAKVLPRLSAERSMMSAGTPADDEPAADGRSRVWSGHDGAYGWYGFLRRRGVGRACPARVAGRRPSGSGRDTRPYSSTLLRRLSGPLGGADAVGGDADGVEARRQVP